MSADGAHFHPYLDIEVDGRNVPVAADIGVDAATGTMSELHTHDGSGIIHIESASKDRTYRLGQLFTDWGLRLDRTHLGVFTTDSARSLAVYVDGARFTGDPADIELTPHRQVALQYGTPAQQAPPPSTASRPASRPRRTRADCGDHTSTGCRRARFRSAPKSPRRRSVIVRCES